MAAKKGYKFEAFIRTSLIEYFKHYHVPAYVRREYQNIPNFLGTDITVDSAYNAMVYMAIECKSRIEAKRYNFAKMFPHNQFERINTFLYLSGRRGFLAIQLHKRPKNKVFIIKWDDLHLLYARGQPSFRMFDPSELPRPVKKDEVAAREMVKNVDGMQNLNEVFA